MEETAYVQVPSEKERMCTGCCFQMCPGGCSRKLYDVEPCTLDTIYVAKEVTK